MAKGGNPDAGWSNARSAAGDRNPWLVVLVISLATFMEVLDTSIANVAINHIAGSLAVSNDESTWVLTAYLVANAIIVPISGWLSDVIGRKRFYMLSVALFTLASLVCGLSVNLPMLVVARIIQGFGGGGLATSEQSFLADTFPPSKRGMAFAAYGVVVIVAPVVGPALGGLITDQLSWHWIFLINFPVGVLSLVLVHFLVTEPKALEDDRRKLLKAGVRVDGLGFVLVALGLGCLEIFMDRGQRDDWFGSGFITAMAIIAVVSLALLVVWELTRERPIVDIQLFRVPNFLVCFVMMLNVGVIIYGSTQVIPQLLQEVFGYTATDAGLTLTVGGLISLAMMPLAGGLSGVVQGRWLLAFAFAAQGVAMWIFTGFNTTSAFHGFAVGRLVQSIGIPFLFVPITAQSYADLDPRDYNQASALMNVARNLGGSIGISAAQTLLQRREQFHQSRLVEALNPLNPLYGQKLSQIKDALAGAPSADPSQLQLATLYRSMTTQAAMLSYLDVFKALMVFMFCVVPLALLLKPIKSSE